MRGCLTLVMVEKHTDVWSRLIAMPTTMEAILTSSTRSNHKLIQVSPNTCEQQCYCDADVVHIADGIFTYPQAFGR